MPAAQNTPCQRRRLASNGPWIHSVEIRRKHMVYIFSIKKYGWEPRGAQDAITNTGTWQGLAGEDRIFLCLPDNLTGVRPTGEQSIWLWPVAPWQSVLAETLTSAWEASSPPPPAQPRLPPRRPPLLPKPSLQGAMLPPLPANNAVRPLRYCVAVQGYCVITRGQEVGTFCFPSSHSKFFFFLVELWLFFWRVIIWVDW